jgi:hypothetical protein
MQLGATLLLLAFGKGWQALDRPTLLLWLTAIVIPFAVSFVQPVFWARFTVVALPALALAAGI